MERSKAERLIRNGGGSILCIKSRVPERAKHKLSVLLCFRWLSCEDRYQARLNARLRM